MLQLTKEPLYPWARLHGVSFERSRHLTARASAKGAEVTDLVNDLLKSDIEFIETVK